MRNIDSVVRDFPLSRRARAKLESVLTHEDSRIREYAEELLRENEIEMQMLARYQNARKGLNKANDGDEIPEDEIMPVWDDPNIPF